jgi:sulfate permease, SulP family
MPGWLLRSLRGYQAAFLPGDLIAGVMLAAIAVPGQLATARLAGLAPETGLYAFAAGSLAFALVGANRYMSVAADSTIAPIFAGGLAALAVPGTASYAGLAEVLALQVGAILLTVGLLRAGWLATLLSVPVTTGFLAGIAVHIIVGQLPVILGVAPPSGHLLLQVVRLVARLPQANPWSFAVGALVLAVTLGGARIGPRVPGALIAVLAAGLGGALLHLSAHGVDMLGPLSARVPMPGLPSWPGTEAMARLVPMAFVVAMVCIMQTAAVAGTFPSDEDAPENTSQDFAGVGAGNVLAGLLGAFPVDSSPPSTAVVKESGGRSQIAALIAVAVMALLVGLAGGSTAYLPRAALSGILIYIALRIVRMAEIRRIWLRGGREILLVAAAALLVILLPIEQGMLLAIVLSFVHSLYIVARPQSVELARVPGTTVWWPPSPQQRGELEPGVLVFDPGAPLNFTNAGLISQQLEEAVAAKQPPVRLLVIEASSMLDIDYTGSQRLQRTIERLRDRYGLIVALARLSDVRAHEQAIRSGLVEAIDGAHVFMSVEDAVRALKPK